MTTMLPRFHAALLLLSSAVLGGCQASPPMTVATAASGAGAGGQGAPTTTGRPSARGRVVETLNGGGYTYVRVLPAEGPELWAATTEFPVKVGDEVLVDVAMPMENFESKSLGRTFELVYFAESIQVAGGASPSSDAGGGSLLRQLGPQPSPVAEIASGLPAGHGRVVAPAASVDLTGITKAEDGFSVAEILAQSGSLSGRQVAVRGRVVKFTPGVMGRNWLHLRDGSGEGGAADITVTTDSDASVGDLVVAKGLLITDQDFGSGYAYDVLMQDAVLTRE